MARPVTLFTGQWADLPVADLAARCAAWGFDAVERGTRSSRNGGDPSSTCSTPRVCASA
jgi:sugar phosphate isomerase/epimerase